MSYPDNVLAPGEQVVVHRHPHWNRLILARFRGADSDDRTGGVRGPATSTRRDLGLKLAKNIHLRRHLGDLVGDRRLADAVAIPELADHPLRGD